MAKGASKYSRLPGDASVADFARAQQRKQSGTGTSVRNLKPEELQQLVRQHMTVNPVPDNTDRLSIEMEGQIQLRVTDIDPYDKNPRQAPNEQYEAIKESIRSSRMLSPLVVTKRPNSPRYMVAAGGNTRLRIQTELWLETQDPRFEYVLANYRPWESELKVMAAHVAENELRGGMIFWDKAQGIWTMKAELEQERGQSLSLRQLHDALRGHGLVVSIALLSYYSFALDNLAELGDATQLLSATTTLALQPAFKHLSTYFISTHNRSAEEWHRLRVAVLQRTAQLYETKTEGNDEAPGRERTIDPQQLIAAMEQAIADALAQPVEQIRDVRQLAKAMPKATISELVQHYQGTQTRKTKPNRPPAPANDATQPLLHVEENSSTGTEPIDTGTSTDNTPSAATLTISRTPETPSAETETVPAENPLEAVQQRITTFARLCGFADCLQLTEAMPAGFYVETPADDTPIDLDPSHADYRNRYVGWWLSAMHSGQIGGEFSHRLPADSKWRQAQLMENSQDETALSWLIETVLGNPIGLIEMADWLTHPGNQAVVEYQQLLQAIQRLRSLHPERFAIEGAT